MRLKMSTKGTVYNYRIGQTFRQQKFTYDMVFVDPPYEITITRQMIDALTKIINPRGALVLEQSRKQSTVSVCSELEMLYNKNYGDSQIVIYNKVA